MAPATHFQASSHQWLSTCIAVLALFASGAAALFTWQGNQAKNESLSITSQANDSCSAEFIGSMKGGEIGICWSVTLANGSEDPVSLVDYHVFSVLESGLAEIGGFTDLEYSDGRPLALPLNLASGEAKRITVRVAFPVSAPAAGVIAQLPEYKLRTLSSLTLRALSNKLAVSGLDAVGNKVSPFIYEGKVMGWSYGQSMSRAVGLLQLTTGRGREFQARMSYPPD